MIGCEPLLLVQAGTPPERVRDALGDLPAWFRKALGPRTGGLQVVRIFEGEELPRPDGRRAIITGSWDMVTDRLPWSEAAAQWIREAVAAEMPLFGVCYGHQLMAHALGGEVDYHPEGREVGTQIIRLVAGADRDPLLKSLPPQFAAHLSHSQSVMKLPPGAIALGASDHDPHQIVRYGEKAISTQFHPEFTPEISAAIIRFGAGVLQAEGRNTDALLDAIEDAPEPLRLLRRFVSAA